MKLDKKEVVLRRIRLMEQEGVKFICNANVGRERRAPDLPQGVRRDGHLHRGHAAARPAGRGPRPYRRPLRDGLPDRQHDRRPRREAGRVRHPRERQGRGRHRRRRHGHRLRRDRDAPRLPEPGADRDPAPAARGPGRRQSVAGMAQGLQAGLRPGGGGSPLRRRPAGLPDDREEVRRRRRGAGQGPRDGRDQVGEERAGAVRAEGGARHREGAPRAACPPRDGLPRAGTGASQGDGGRLRPPHQHQGRATRSTRPAFRGFSRPATAGAARAWWCGRSTRAAAPRASATAT